MATTWTIELKRGDSVAQFCPRECLCAFAQTLIRRWSSPNIRSEISSTRQEVGKVSEINPWSQRTATPFHYRMRMTTYLHSSINILRLNSVYWWMTSSARWSSSSKLHTLTPSDTWWDRECDYIENVTNPSGGVTKSIRLKKSIGEIND